MAARMQCPSCGEFLAEEGDIDKGRNGKFYRVYDSVANMKREAGERRLLKCLVCGHSSDIECWDD